MITIRPPVAGDERQRIEDVLVEFLVSVGVQHGFDAFDLLELLDDVAERFADGPVDLTEREGGS